MNVQQKILRQNRMRGASPSVQLEIAAQWLAEAALSINDKTLRLNLERVASDCLRAASQKATA
jgi:hypothetical protein